MRRGEEAVRKRAEMDKSLGLQDPQDVVRRMRGPQNTQVAENVTSTGEKAR